MHTPDRMRTPPLTGLVLAGGASRRMGRDKAMILVDGEPLAALVARRLATVCDDVVIASGDGRRLAALGYRQVADVLADAGPLAGIVAGLVAATTPLVAVAAVDMPFAAPAVFRSLAERWDGAAAVVPVVDGRPQPLHAVYATAAADRLRRCLAGGGRSVTDALSALEARFVGAEAWAPSDPAGRFATNVNRPDQLRDLTGP